MRLKKFAYYSLALLLIGGSFSCEHDDVPDPAEPTVCPSLVYPQNAKLLRSYYGRGNENGNVLMEEYEYDANGKISKVITPYYENGKLNGTLQYEAYTYDANGRLAEIATYSRMKDGNFNKYSVLRYTYTPEGLKETEIQEFVLVGTSTLKRFYYEKGKMERCEGYDAGKLVETILYEYGPEGKLAKETTYYEGKPLRYILYTYETTADATKDKMVEYMVGEIDVPQREMERIYDPQGNLITFSNRELRLESSRSSYVIYYEYEP